MDLFSEQHIHPMLMYETQPFNDADFIFELKLDGIRCIAYLDPKNVQLRNKRNKDITALYPELSQIKQCVKKKCILDGELIALTDGKPDFYQLQSRSLMSDAFKIRLAAQRNPILFVAYDILYFNGEELTDKPLMRRKEILGKNIIEGHGLALSRWIEQDGVAFFDSAKQQDLEGIVAKNKNSIYHIGRRTRDWLKIKVMQDEDVVICGYQPDGDGMVKDLVLGYYDGDALRYRGKVFLGVSKEVRKTVFEFARKNKRERPPKGFKRADGIIWIKPQIEGTVHFMQETPNGTMRQPVFKGLKE